MARKEPGQRGGRPVLKRQIDRGCWQWRVHDPNAVVRERRSRAHDGDAGERCCKNAATAQRGRGWPWHGPGPSRERGIRPHDSITATRTHISTEPGKRRHRPRNEAWHARLPHRPGRSRSRGACRSSPPRSESAVHRDGGAGRSAPPARGEGRTPGPQGHRRRRGCDFGDGSWRSESRQSAARFRHPRVARRAGAHPRKASSPRDPEVIGSARTKGKHRRQGATGAGCAVAMSDVRGERCRSPRASQEEAP
jgi:hypothetical protein